MIKTQIPTKASNVHNKSFFIKHSNEHLRQIIPFGFGHRTKNISVISSLSYGTWNIIIAKVLMAERKC